jgi:hypothetical protein
MATEAERQARAARVTARVESRGQTSSGSSSRNDHFSVLGTAGAIWENRIDDMGDQWKAVAVSALTGENVSYRSHRDINGIRFNNSFSTASLNNGRARVNGSLMGGVGVTGADGRGVSGVSGLGNPGDSFDHFVSLVAEAQLTHNPNKYAEAMAFGQMLAENDQKPGKAPGTRDPDRINFPSGIVYPVPLPNNPSYGIMFTGDDWRPADAVGHVVTMISQNAGMAPVFSDPQFMQQAQAAYQSGSWRQANAAGAQQGSQQNGQQQGSQQANDKGAYAVQFSQQAQQTIANLPLTALADPNAVAKSLGLDDSVTANALQNSLASATPEARAQFKKNLDDGLNALEQKAPAELRPQLQSGFAAAHAKIDEWSKVTAPATQQNGAAASQSTDANAAARMGVLESVQFGSEETQKQWNTLLGQEKGSMKGGFAAFFTKIISMIVNTISGHPEMNSPEEFIAAHKDQLTAPSKSSEEVLAALKSGVAPKASEQAPPGQDGAAAGTPGNTQAQTPAAGAVHVFKDKAEIAAFQTQIETQFHQATEKNGVADGKVDGVLGTTTKGVVLKLEAANPNGPKSPTEGLQISEATYQAIMAAGKQATSVGTTGGHQQDGHPPAQTTPGSAQPQRGAEAAPAGR